MRATWILLVALLVACAGPAAVLDSDDPIEVRTWLDGQPGQAIGVLVVQVDAESGLDVSFPTPQIEGLEVQEINDPLQERVGDRIITTRRFRFTGPPGSYEVIGLKASAKGEEVELEGVSEPLWIALDLESDPLAELADIDEPSKLWSADTLTLLGIGAAIGCTVLGVTIMFWVLRLLFGGRNPRKLPPEPPDVVALRAWDAVRRDPDIDDLEKAKALASIFRVYVEAVLRFPATAWTTTEIVDRLQEMPHLADGNVGRAKRILRATDRIKFADADARESLFDELEDALRTFVGSTRPHSWQGDA